MIKFAFTFVIPFADLNLYFSPQICRKILHRFCFKLRHTAFGFSISCYFKISRKTYLFVCQWVKATEAKFLEQSSVSTCPQCIRIMNYLEWRITARIGRRIATSRITQIDTYEYITHENLTSRAYRGIW